MLSNVLVHEQIHCVHVGVKEDTYTLYAPPGQLQTSPPGRQPTSSVFKNCSECNQGSPHHPMLQLQLQPTPDEPASRLPHIGIQALQGLRRDFPTHEPPGHHVNLSTPQALWGAISMDPRGRHATGSTASAREPREAARRSATLGTW